MRETEATKSKYTAEGTKELMAKAGRAKLGTKMGEGKKNSVGKGKGKGVGKGTPQAQTNLRELRKDYKYLCPGCGGRFHWEKRGLIHVKGKKISEECKSAMNDDNPPHSYVDREGNPSELPP